MIGVRVAGHFICICFVRTSAGSAYGLMTALCTGRHPATLILSHLHHHQQTHRPSCCNHICIADGNKAAAASGCQEETPSTQSSLSGSSQLQSFRLAQPPFAADLSCVTTPSYSHTSASSRRRRFPRVSIEVSFVCCSSTPTACWQPSRSLAYLCCLQSAQCLEAKVLDVQQPC